MTPVELFELNIGNLINSIEAIESLLDSDNIEEAERQIDLMYINVKALENTVKDLKMKKLSSFSREQQADIKNFRNKPIVKISKDSSMKEKLIFSLQFLDEIPSLEEEVEFIKNNI